MILFRCDANPLLGMGHLSRCRALAHELRKHDVPCLMLGPSKRYATDEDKNLFLKWEPNDWCGSKSDVSAIAKMAMSFGTTS
jgi:spore coat polysaccharide biosynthesis predicted glycosyltransferase SpsG